MVLFIDSCIREGSRTKVLADFLLEKLGQPYKHLYLPSLGLQPLNKERLEKRMALLQEGKTSGPLFDLAHEFASADTIVIAAPFYDLGFPALLKIYLENVYIIGVTSVYQENGMPKGLCKARDLYYVATSGGPFDPRFSFDYVKNLAQVCFGIPSVHLFKAEFLDVVGADVPAIMEAAKQEIMKL